MLYENIIALKGARQPDAALWDFAATGGRADITPMP